MSLTSKMPLQVWILTLSAFAIGTAEFVIAGILTQVADSLAITEGQAGHLITAYALAIVIGGPILTLWLARFDKRMVLIGLMGLFVAGNLVTAFTSDYTILLASRVLTGLTQGPFYGIGAVVATRLVAKELEGQAVGQMFAGLTLANVLGVPAGAWIGHSYGWNVTFMVVAALGVLATAAIVMAIPRQEREEARSLSSQIGAFRDRNLLTSLAITVLGWVGFMTFYGYIAPVAEQVAGFDRSALTWILVAVGLGLVIGNSLGGKSADANLSRALIMWPCRDDRRPYRRRFARPLQMAVRHRRLRLRCRLLRQRAAHADARHEIWRQGTRTGRDCEHLGLQYRQCTWQRDRRHRGRQQHRRRRHPLRRRRRADHRPAVHHQPGAETCTSADP